MSIQEMGSALWAHGYGAPPDHPLHEAARQEASEEGMRLAVPQLNDIVHHNDTLHIVMPPLEVQAERIAPILEDSPDRIVAHSQGAWALAFALGDGANTSPKQEVILLAPALSCPLQRLERHLAEPNEAEQASAEPYGGAHGVVRARKKGRPPTSIVIPRDYWEEIGGYQEDGPGFPWLGLVAETLGGFKRARVITPGDDEQFGEQSAAYARLREAAPHATFEVLPGAKHEFPGMERQIAHAALTGSGWRN